MSSGSRGDTPSPVSPPRHESHVSTVHGEAEDDGVGRDELTERADDLMRRVRDLEESILRKEGRRPIVSPVPERPTEEEVREHNATHTPPKPWCPYCTEATASRDPHSRVRKEVPDIEVTLDRLPTLSVDFMYLYEKGARPTLVMVDR